MQLFILWSPNSEEDIPLNRKLSRPKSEDNFLPSFESALTNQEVCFSFIF